MSVLPLAAGPWGWAEHPRNGEGCAGWVLCPQTQRQELLPEPRGLFCNLIYSAYNLFCLGVLIPGEKLEAGACPVVQVVGGIFCHPSQKR